MTGNGMPVILLHGWGSNRSCFQGIIEYLKNYFTVYSIDLPGFGDSEEPNEPWDLNRYVDMLCDFVSMQMQGDIILIGHSFGGRIIIKAVATKLKNVKKIVLVDSAGIRPKRNVGYYLRVYSFKAIKRVLTLPIVRKYTCSILEIARGKFGSSDYRAASQVMRSTMVKAISEDLRCYLPLLTCPVLLVWGGNDTATPLSDAAIMEKLIPDSGLVVFPGTGHWSFLENARGFRLVLDSFLTAEKRGRKHD